MLRHERARTGKKGRLIAAICIGAVVLIAATVLILTGRAKRNMPESALAASAVKSAVPLKNEAEAAKAPASTAANPPIKTPAKTPPAKTPGATDAAVVEITPTPTPLPLSRYTAIVEAHPDAKVPYADVALKLDYVNDTGDTLYALMLRLWPNAMQNSCLRIQTVTQDGVESQYSTTTGASGDGSALTIPLSRDLKSGESITIGMDYTIDVPEGEGRFGVNELGMNLGNAFPAIAPYEDGAWREDIYETIGDSFFGKAAEYSVVIRCPQTYSVAASGEAGTGRFVEEEGRYEGIYTAAPARDFAIALVKNAFVETASSKGGVRVLAYSKQKQRSRTLADNAASALSYFESKLGAYPYKDLCAVATDITGGMEYPGLILVDYEDLDGSRMPMGELYTAHEIAHQWFYNLVGSDQSRAPWVDEALVEFLSFDYIRSVYGQAYMEQLWSSRFHDINGCKIEPRMDASLSDYAKAEKNDYVYGVYARGSAMYEEIYQKLGANAFYRVLSSLVKDCRFGVTDGAMLIERFSKAAGEDLAPLFEKYMTLQPADAQSEETWAS